MFASTQYISLTLACGTSAAAIGDLDKKVNLSENNFVFKPTTRGEPWRNEHAMALDSEINYDLLCTT